MAAELDEAACKIAAGFCQVCAGVRIARPRSEHRSESVSSGTEQSHCFPSMTGFGLQIAQVDVGLPRLAR